MAAQTDKQVRRRASSRPPDLGWPARPWYGDVERVVGVAVVAVLLLAVLIALVVKGGSAPTGAPAPVVSEDGGQPAVTPSAPGTATSTTAVTDPPDTQWYSGSAAARGQLDDSGTLVRRHVEANDGVALEPECARLGSVVADARALPAAADSTTVRLWSDVVEGYADASTACAQLFDGTRIEVEVLLSRTTSALDDAERALTALDESFSGR